MDTQKVIQELKRKYPGKFIVLNTPEETTEIICETKPGKDYSEAVAIVDKIRPHYHKVLTETYKVTKGELVHYLGDKKSILKVGDKVVIPPNTVHWAEGNETWFDVTSIPGWTPEDHISIR